MMQLIDLHHLSDLAHYIDSHKIKFAYLNQQDLSQS